MMSEFKDTECFKLKRHCYQNNLNGAISRFNRSVFMKIPKLIILALCFHVHVIFPSIALADFKVYSSQEVPLFELGINLLDSEKGKKFLVGAEGPTLKHALCSGFGEVAQYIQTEIEGNKSSSKLKVAGLQVDFQSLYGGSLFVDKVIISKGENYISCISQTEEKTNDALLISEQFEQYITPNGELDLRKTFKGDICTYQLLEHGYFPEDDLFAVSMGFKCTS